MGTPNVREQLVAELDHLTDEQVALLLHYAQDLHGKPDADEIEGDPMVGFISGPTDLAERTEDILWAEFGLRNETDE